MHLVSRHARAVLLVLVWALVTTRLCLQTRWNNLSFDDRGSETTEKAVLTAIGLGLALGLGAAITAVVTKYQGQIQ